MSAWDGVRVTSRAGDVQQAEGFSVTKGKKNPMKKPPLRAALP
jgi:hypothetical protein